MEDYPGVEFKSIGRQVVAAGSIHPNGEYYIWDDNTPSEMPECPANLLRLITRPQRSAITSGGQLDEEQVEKILSRLDPLDYPTNDTWEPLMMSLHHGSNGDGRQPAIEWSISHPKFAHNADEIGRRWDLSHTTREDGAAMRTIGTLRHILGKANALDVLPPDQDEAREDFKNAGEPDHIWEPPEPEPMLWDMNRANEMLEHAQTRMLDGNAPLYQTGGRVVYPVRSSQASDDELVRRPSGALTVHEVKSPRMQLFMIEHARFVRYQKPPRGGEPKFVKQPATENLAKLCLAAPDLWRFPQLVGIIEAPTLRADGTLLTEPGYDPKSGLLLDLGSTKFPSIPDEPSCEEALAALTLLKKPFEVPVRPGRPERDR